MNQYAPTATTTVAIPSCTLVSREAVARGDGEKYQYEDPAPAVCPNHTGHMSDSLNNPASAQLGFVHRPGMGLLT